MRSVSVEALVRGRSAAEVFNAIRDFEHYPNVCDAVRSVRVVGEDTPAGELTSEWEVDFGDGVLEWTERDRIRPQEGTITFTQLTGDFEQFRGEWRFTDDDGDCRVRFSAEIDMGIPSLQAMLEPMAERALRDNVQMILRGLLGNDAHIEG